MNRIAIIMDGGLIQDIFADEDVYVTTVDYDTEDASEEDLAKVQRNDGRSVEAFIGYPIADISDGARKFLDRLDRTNIEGVNDHQGDPG